MSKPRLDQLIAKVEIDIANNRVKDINEVIFSLKCPKKILNKLMK
jgi:hypothetical protein